MTGPDRNRQQ